MPLVVGIFEADIVDKAVGAYVRDEVERNQFNVAHGGVGPGGAADDALEALAAIVDLTHGGDIFIPYGVTLNTAISFTASNSNHAIRLYGPGYGRGAITCTTPNVEILTFAAQKLLIENLTLSAIATGPSNAKAFITITSGTVKVIINNLDCYGGLHAIRCTGGANITISGGWMQKVYGSAVVMFDNCPGAVALNDVAIDTAWPSSELAATSFSNPAADGSNDKGNWAATTSYSLKDFVVANGFVLQCVEAGTSHSSTAPAVGGYIYGQHILDNTVKWRLAGNALCAPVRVRGGPTFDIVCNHVDMTGAYLHGLVVDDPSPAGPPNWIRMYGCTVAGTHGPGIKITKAKNILIRDNDLQQFFGGSGDRVGIDIDAGSTAIPIVTGNKITQAGFGATPLTIGIDIGVDGGVYNENYIRGASFGILVGANLSYQEICSNDVGNLGGGAACATGVHLTAGSGDWQRVLNNKTNGCTTDVNNVAAGANSWIEGNGP